MSRLLGAEDRLRAFSGFAGFAETPAWRHKTQESLREQCGDVWFTVTWESGRALAMDEAIAEAIVLAGELSSPPG